MSLPATHIRFALALKNQYQVDNLAQYLSGAVYPDSRYLTSLDRALTHNEDLLIKHWANTDFKKGWQSHYICDVAHNMARNKIFPELFSADLLSAHWLPVVVLKIVQDIDDVQNFDVQKYLSCLDYVDNPNGENLDLIKKYNQLVIGTYLHKNTCQLGDYELFLRAMPFEKSILNNIFAQVAEYLDKPDILAKSKKIYQEALGMATLPI